MAAKALTQEEVDCSLGLKFDGGKLRYDLIPPEIKLWLAEILTHGAKKYAPDNWKNVEVNRYIAAMERHMVAWQLGEEYDPDSGYHHLKHILTNAAFIAYLAIPIDDGDE